MYELPGSPTEILIHLNSKRVAKVGKKKKKESGRAGFPVY